MAEILQNPSLSTPEKPTPPPETADATNTTALTGRARGLANLKPWKPGESGGGHKHAQKVRKLARTHTAEALETLVSIMRNGRAPATERRKAANDILAWGWGKPVAQVTQQVIGAQAPAPSVTVNVGGPVAGMSPDQAYAWMVGNPNAPAEQLAEAEAILALPAPPAQERTP